MEIPDLKVPEKNEPAKPSGKDIEAENFTVENRAAVKLSDK